MTAFLIYAALFRLAVIAAGVTSIVLGYFLFSKGLFARRSVHTRSNEIEAKIGTAGLTLRNTAPGTAFAMFGAALIVTMTVQGLPEWSSTPVARDDKSASEPAPTRVVLRGDDPLALTDMGIAAERRKDLEGAIDSYHKALAAMTTPMNNLAWLYNERGDGTRALPLAQAAVQLRDDNAAYHDTLATVLMKMGRREEALSALREAARLDSRYQAKVDQLDARTGGGR